MLATCTPLLENRSTRGSPGTRGIDLFSMRGVEGETAFRWSWGFVNREREIRLCLAKIVRIKVRERREKGRAVRV